MRKPLFSIIIPAYNAENNLADCLESIASQTFKSYEVIFMDGGSTDGTLKRVGDFCHSESMEIQITSEKDNGIYDAVNKGIKRAKGQWMYILGTDDKLYSPSVLEEVAATIRSTDRVVYGNVKVIGHAGWAKDGEIHDGEFSISKLLQRNICQQAVFYRKEIFEELGYFNDQYKVCADWDFILRCAAKFELTYMNVIVARFHGGGASSIGESDNFYAEFPGNLYQYFGRRILRDEFHSVAWRFGKAADMEKRKGNWWRAMIFGKAAKQR